MVQLFEICCKIVVFSTEPRTNFLAPNLPFVSPLTQLHGWWHLFAGYATYLHIISCIYHRQKFLKRDAKFQLCWIGFTVTYEDNVKTENGVKNGTASKNMKAKKHQSIHIQCISIQYWTLFEYPLVFKAKSIELNNLS